MAYQSVEQNVSHLPEHSVVYQQVLQLQQHNLLQITLLKIATTAYTDAAITAVIGGAPGTLDTLNELAAAINDDASYATTLTTALATKLPLAGGTLTGTLNVTGDGEDVIINSSDYELMLLGNRGASGSNLDKAYLRMKSEGTNTIILDTSGSTFLMVEMLASKWQTQMTCHNKRCMSEVVEQVFIQAIIQQTRTLFTQAVAYHSQQTQMFILFVTLTKRVQHLQVQEA